MAELCFMDSMTQRDLACMTGLPVGVKESPKSYLDRVFEKAVYCEQYCMPKSMAMWIDLASKVENLLIERGYSI